METKVCKVCGRELPLSQFMVTRWGGYTDNCNECIAKKRTQTRYNNYGNMQSVGGGSKTTPFSDPDFDGKQPVEVIQFMSRAKRWLEAHGYTITLKGTYTQVREIKF